MPVGRNKGKKHTVSDPRPRIASTANKDKRSRTMKTKSGSEVNIKKSTYEDAKAGKGAFKEPSGYKGSTIKNKSGKMSGIKTHSGEYTRTTDPVSRKKAAKKLAYDKKLYESQSSKKRERNKRFASAKKRGS